MKSFIFFETPFDSAQGDCQTDWPPYFIGQNVKMTESCINAVISTSARGEIFSKTDLSYCRDDNKIEFCYW